MARVSAARVCTAACLRARVFAAARYMDARMPFLHTISIAHRRYRRIQGSFGRSESLRHTLSRHVSCAICGEMEKCDLLFPTFEDHPILRVRRRRAHSVLDSRI